ncbi:MAG: cytochrome C oxidase subunit IV family protein [Acidimicrobiales bacterium]
MSKSPQPVVAPAEAHTVDDHGAHHPSDRQYVMIALFLAFITGAEVVMSYVELGGLLVPGLIILSLIKFIIVVMWFMHLRFDDRLFRRVFVTGLVLAFFIYGVVLLTFNLPR